jgi:hypothetical protein
MAGVTGAVADVVRGKLGDEFLGVNARIATILADDGTLPTLAGIRSIVTQNVSPEISDKAGNIVYPALLIYCDKLSNQLKEKFRDFSGTGKFVIEVRQSQDQIASIEQNLQVYVDAVCALLDDSRGDWGNGTFYTGGYDVSYEPVARGGKNFLQRAKVAFQVEISK